MSITYTNENAVDPQNFGIIFQMKIDVTQAIGISIEALQDFDPENKQYNVEQQFENNQNRIIEIARAKIEKVLQGIYITTEDIK